MVSSTSRAPVIAHEAGRFWQEMPFVSGSNRGLGGGPHQAQRERSSQRDFDSRFSRVCPLRPEINDSDNQQGPHYDAEANAPDELGRFQSGLRSDRVRLL